MAGRMSVRFRSFDDFEEALSEAFAGLALEVS